MSGITFYIILSIVVVALGMGIFIFALKKITQVSSNIIDKAEIIAHLRQTELEENNRPISVGGGNSLYLPMIWRDFPDFHQATMEEKVKRFLFIYFRSLEKKDVSLLNDDAVTDTDTIKEMVKAQVPDIGEHQTETYDNVFIHAIAISDYIKTRELATVRYQVSLEYIGKSNKKIQVKYSVDITYIFRDMAKESFSLRCNFCSGTLQETSTKCEYCGTLVVRNIDMVWRISNFKKIRQIG